MCYHLSHLHQYLLTEMDGYEATRLIREQEHATRQPPGIIEALTASTFSGDQEKCLAAGMNDYLPKPLHLSELCDCFERYLPPETAPVSSQNATSS